jgi:predicted dehydrogenase
MTENIKVLVLGSGYAGQGHAEAFKHAGAEVVGLVGRTKDVVESVSKELKIPYWGTDFTEALKVCKPDIVAIGTPGGAHFAPVMEALEFGCHVFSDKPLAESAEKAKLMYEKAVEKKLKTAYAASYRYMPAVLYAKRMISEGKIGEPREVECISHFNLEKDIPFGWSHRIDQGGGRLNNNFTHVLSIVTNVLGEKILAVSGEVRNDMPKAPIVEGVHKFTERRKFIPEDLSDPSLKWGDADVEWSYTVQAKIESDYPAASPVSVLIKHGGLVPRFTDDHLVFYGSTGAIFIKGHYGKGPLYLFGKGGQWIEQDIPQDIISSLPAIEDDTQRNWTHLACEFVKDIQGKSVASYQTFKDGWQYQEIVDIIRKNCLWTDVTQLN